MAASALFNMMEQVRAWMGLSRRPEYLRVGRAGEDAAARHLRDNGFRIIARNARVPMGEADIVAEHGEVHIVVEVKTRIRDDDAPERSNAIDPEASVTQRKLAKLRRITAWLARHNQWERTRIDVIAVEVRREGSGFRIESLRHLPDVR